MKKLPNAVMQWIGGPAKDLGEKEGSGKFAAVGSTGSSKLENAGSNAALRKANRDGGGGGEGGGAGEGGGPLTKEDVKEAAEEAMSEQQGSGPKKDQDMGEKKP